MDRIEKLCVDKGMRMTEQRRVIARVISASHDHTDVEELHRRAAAVDPGISIATVYRTVRLFEEAGILERHDFRDGRSRYEEMPETHHDHLIDMKAGKVIEFVDPEIERLQHEIAKRLGYRLVDHRLELYGVPLAEKAKAKTSMNNQSPRALQRVFIETYGCQMNVYDSERMRDVLAPLGYAPVDKPDDADLVVLNTCHIREKATEKVYSEIGRLRAHKERRMAEGKAMSI